jgi:quercetin dioxygenase-like cupin family protein
MAYEPTMWKLSDMVEGTTEPGAVDPQTDGKLWQIYPVANNGVIDVLYGHVEANNRTGAHTHPDANHYTTVVKGTATVWLDGTVVEVHEGDIVNIPTGVLHDFGATADDDVWVVDLTNPPFDPAKMAFDPSRDEEIAAAFAQRGFAQG